jgi:hypothetical protein
MPRSFAWILAAVSLTAGLGFMTLANLQSGKKMTEAAVDLIEKLSPEQREQAVLPYGSEQRVGWHFIPKPTRKGAVMNKMTDEQQAATHELLQAALSAAGFKKTKEIMALEALLREMEKDTTGRRDPLKYYVTFFGTPGRDAKWGLSFEGHHLSLNFVVEGDEVVSATPHFLGANPNIKGGAEPPRGGDTNRPVLFAEEAYAFQLVNSLDEKQREQAIISEEAPKEIQAAGEPQVPEQEDIGLPLSEMSEAQQDLLKGIIGAYVGNVPEDVAARAWKDINSGDKESIRFVWSGALKPAIGHGYRIFGPTFVIELVNVQPDAQGNPANHIHAVWRDPRGDFALSRN